MTGFEITLLVLVVVITIIMGWRVHIWKKLANQWKETANLYSNMYAESAEILADLVINGDDFGEK